MDLQRMDCNPWKPVTNGKFRDATSSNDFNKFSGNVALPSPNGANGFSPENTFYKMLHKV